MRAVLVPLDIDPGLPPAGSRQAQLGGTTMGTSWSARFMQPPGVDADLGAALQAELDGVNAQMSHWKPDSLLSIYNAAPAGSWHALPPQFLEVIDYALQVEHDSAGAYDPAAGDIVDLWGFGPGAGAHKRYDQAGFYAPAPAAVTALLARRAPARAREGLHTLLDRANKRLLQPGGVVLDLSAVAKGYAVDRLALCLQQHGVRHYLVEIGGELRGAGVKGDGQPWWVEVEGVPDAEGTPGEQPVVALHGLAIATSGDYRRYFQQAQRRVPHTLDPRTGQPIANGLASVTVLAATCMQADALSTALTVLGPQTGMAFAEQHRLAARFLLRRQDGGLLESTSPAWDGMMQ